MIAYTNRVVSYQRCMKSEAKKLVGNMSESQKQRLLNNIKVRQGVSNLTNQQYDSNMLQHVEKLLQINS